MASSSLSWRWISAWLRRARLTNTPEIPLRSRACSTAASTAARRASLNARPTSPISSEPKVSGGASVSTSTVSPALNRSMTLGS